MKMAKASERDIDAAGNAMSVLQTISSGYFPTREGEEDAPTFLDPNDRDHLRRFYDMMNETLDASPGWPGRVIGGMCYVIMYDKNQIVDPDADVIELHPRFAEMEKQRDELLAALGTQAAKDVIAERQRQINVEGWTPEHDDQHEVGELATAAACYAGNAGGYVWQGGWPGEVWPWAREWWKPSTQRRDLVKSAAMILAEIERIDRAAIASVKGDVKSTCTKCNTPDLCKEYGRACDPYLGEEETTAPAIVFYPAGSLGEEVAP